MSSREVLVVGCGVSGLSCAIILAERGWRVRVIAAAKTPNTTSDIAGGLWLPFRVEPRDKVLRWSGQTLSMLTELERVKESGVFFADDWELFRSPTEPGDIWWLPAVPQWRRLTREELPAGCVDGYAVRVPIMDVPIYLPYLHRRLAEAGATLEILPAPLESLDGLLEANRLIVNCTGLGAGKLCNDPEVFPIRGQLLRTTNPGITRSICDDRNPNGVTYLVARSRDCVLGGTTDTGNWNTEPSEADGRRILADNLNLEPRIAQAKITGSVVGLRPGRTQIRLEAEARPEGRWIVHNYGHGGAGYTTSWGCAMEVADLIQSR